MVLKMETVHISNHCKSCGEMTECISPKCLEWTERISPQCLKWTEHNSPQCLEWTEHISLQCLEQINALVHNVFIHSFTPDAFLNWYIGRQFSSSIRQNFFKEICKNITK